MAEKRKGPRPGTRRLVQLYAALLYNAHLKGFITGEIYTGPVKAVCVPGLNCYSCPAAAAACPLGSLQNALAAAGHTAPWYMAGILLLFGALLGRTVCGWLCPFGLVQELLHRIPTPKLRKSRITRALSLLKFGILAVFVILLPLYYGLAKGLTVPAFCKFICPAGTLEGAGALLAHPGNTGLFAQLGILFTNKFVILAVLITLCIFCFRAFCRFLCPLGAIYGLFSRFALTGMRVDADRCTRCGACVRVCETDVRRVGDRECIACGKCAAACPEAAISLRCGKIVLKGPETPARGATPPAPNRRARLAVRAVLCALLAAALVFFNLPGQTPPETPAQAASEQDGIPVGSAPGQRPEDFTCVLSDGSVFRLSDHRGQIVFINQWATYCGPCVKELPYFETLSEEHPDVVVLAFHHWPQSRPDAASFIESQGWSGWSVLFAADTQEQPLLKMIGGDNTMPRTMVLDREGVVVWNEQRSVTPEMLDELLELAEAGTSRAGE